MTQPYGAGAELEVCTYLCIYRAPKFQHASASLGGNAIEKGVQDTAFLPQFPSGTTDLTFPCLIYFGHLCLSARTSHWGRERGNGRFWRRSPQ